MIKIALTLLLSLILTSNTYALDLVFTNDGSKLMGTITAITPTHIQLSTSYAEQLTIGREHITGFSTSEDISLRLKDDTVISSKVTAKNMGSLVLTHHGAHQIQTLDNIQEAWPASTEDPAKIRLVELEQSKKRHWSIETGADVSGKNGNNNEFKSGFSFDAELANSTDSLQVFAAFLHEENDDDEDKTNEEYKAGIEYSSFYYDPWGWYIRSQAERDDTSNLDYRAVLGAGLHYRVLTLPIHSLSLRSGLGYRYEKFDDGRVESAPTLDLGLKHEWQFVDWARMKNHLTYAPTLEQFSHYLFTHESNLEIPLGTTDLFLLEMGIRNQYQSQPAPGRKNLDTRYHSTLKLKWP